MTITAEAYFTPAVDLEYMSNSQYKTFCKCEAGAMSQIRGESIRKSTSAMLIGSYVDAALLGELDEFKAEAGAVLFTSKGELKAEFKHAEYIIERCRRDEMFMKYLDGETQVIATGEIAGVPFRGKIDVYHKDVGVIVDLKTCADFSTVWDAEERCRIPFVEAWGYDTQLAIYQWLIDKSARCFIAAVTKENEPDIAIMEIPQERLDFCISLVGERVKRFQSIKNGDIEPARCERCNYCKSTKKLNEVVDYRTVGI